MTLDDEGTNSTLADKANRAIQVNIVKSLLNILSFLRLLKSMESIPGSVVPLAMFLMGETLSDI